MSKHDNIDENKRTFLKLSLMLGGSVLLTQTMPALSSPNQLKITKISGQRLQNASVAHAISWQKQKITGDKQALNEYYDLIIVGAGISGLASAYFYQQKYPKHRILILDALDEFGGHARRIETRINNQTYLSYGGSQSLEEPSQFSPATKQLLKELGINLNDFRKGYDKGFFKRHNLAGKTFLNANAFGQNHLSDAAAYDLSQLLPGLITKPFNKAIINKMPLTDSDKESLYKVYSQSYRIAEKLFEHEGDRALDMYYGDFLREVLDIQSPVVEKIIRKVCTDDVGQGLDALTLEDAAESNAPGFSFLKEYYDEPYIYHFPDGNASIARLLLKAINPEALTGNSKYALLDALHTKTFDRPNNKINIRLQSTVVNITPDHNRNTLTYSNNNQLYTVQSKHVICACFNQMIPYIVPTLPHSQKELLLTRDKIPYVYATVFLKNWQALKKAGVGAIYAPAEFFYLTLFDYPIKLIPELPIPTPDNPVALTMIATPLTDNYELEANEQFRQGRYELMQMTTDKYQSLVTKQLDAILSGYGFNSSKDIHEIVINQWAHGYVYSEDIRSPAKANQSFNNIHIAASDSSDDSYLHLAIDRAHEVITEL